MMKVYIPAENCLLKGEVDTDEYVLAVNGHISSAASARRATPSEKRGENIAEIKTAKARCVKTAKA